MTTYFWEKKESAGSWIPFEGSPTAQNPTEDFEAGTWDVRVTASLGSQSDTKTRNAYVTVEEAPSYVGPLDLVPGAVVAYGVRALSAAWLGQPLFKLRNADTDVEQDFNADVVTGEAPLADIATFLNGANGRLVTWYDQSGNGDNAVQATTGSQPFWQSSLVNSKPGFLFEGYRLCTAGTVGITQAFTSYSVARAQEETGGALFGINSGSGENSLDGYAVSGGATQFSIFDDDNNKIQIVADSPQTLTDFFLLEGCLSVASQAMTLNGNNVAFTFLDGSPVLPIAAQRLATASDDFPSGNDFTGNLLEQIIYPTALSSENRTLLQTDEMTYFDL